MRKLFAANGLRSQAAALRERAGLQLMALELELELLLEPAQVQGSFAAAAPGFPLDPATLLRKSPASLHGQHHDQTAPHSVDEFP